MVRKCICTQLAFGDSINTEGGSLQTVLLVRARQSMTHIVSCKSSLDLSYKSHLTVTKIPLDRTLVAKELYNKMGLLDDRDTEGGSLQYMHLLCSRKSMTHTVSCKSGLSQKSQITVQLLRKCICTKLDFGDSVDT